jgi:ribulose-phosphate 3-epimerase
MTGRFIIPGILTDSIDDLRGKVGQAREFATRVSIDVIDGSLANNITVLPQDLVGIDWGTLTVDVQLMVEDPVSYLPMLYKMGTDRVFGQVERMVDQAVFMGECERYGMTGGLGLDLRSPLSELHVSLDTLPAILLMAVKVGFSGQVFEPLVLEKIFELRESGFAGDIVVDGGMNEHSIPLCLEAGANQFSVTSAIWKNDPDLNYQQLSALL